MEYSVEFIRDHELPEEVDWAFVRGSKGLTLCIKPSAITPRVLSEAWAAYRAIEDCDPTIDEYGGLQLVASG